MYLIIKEPETKKDYENYFDIRWQVLRRPLGLPRGSEKDDLEETGIHLMAYTKDNIPIGAGRAHFNSETQAQIRFMAVVPNYRNNGVGGTLLSGLERRVKIGGAKYIVLNSRETATGFYKKYGYSAKGRAVTLFSSVKHIKMRKDL